MEEATTAMFYPRQYQADSEDLNNTCALVQASWQPPRDPANTFHMGDLYWRLRNPSYEQSLWLWEDTQGRLIGFAEWSSTDGTLEMEVHPEHRDLESQILAWAETQNMTVSALASEENSAFINLLTSRGYQLQEKYMNLHRRDLEGSNIETAILPEGYTVRSLRGPEELAARVQGHRAGWQSTLMTEVIYERLMQMPGYRLDLDFVVVAPDGSFVATCNVWLDEKNGIGLFEPVSTHPGYRRKGLARAMLLHGIHYLHTLGAKEAWVASASHNPASTSLYESCGMKIVRRDFSFSPTSIS